MKILLLVIALMLLAIFGVLDNIHKVLSDIRDIYRERKK